MKYLSLSGDIIYKKLFEIVEVISENKFIDENIQTILRKAELIGDFMIKNNKNIGDEEIYFRNIGFIVLDNIDLLGKYLDDSIETKILKSNVFGTYEVIEKTDDIVKFLDVSNGKVYDLVGDMQGSEKRLEDLSVGDITISRFLKFSDGWYNMKHFYYVVGSESPGIEELKISYKVIFSGVKDLYDLEEKMDIFKKETNKIGTNINYLKRIKGILLKPLGKKKFAEVEKILNKKDSDIYGEFFKFISKYRLSKKELEELKEYVIGYLQENSKESKNEDKDLFNFRLKTVINTFFQYLSKSDIEIPEDRKLTEEEAKEFEDIKIKWFLEKNPLYSNKTPLEFLQELDNNYDIKNLQFIQKSREELEFYDGYAGIFTDEEEVIYDTGLEKAKNQDSTSYLDFEKLLKNHGEFFRLRANYIMTRYNYIMKKYMYGEFDDTITYDLATQDRDFLENINYEIKYIKKLKPGYILPNNFEKIVLDTLDKMKLGIGIKIFSFPRKKAEKMIEEGNGEEILNFLQSKIKDFSLDELIEKIRFNSSFYVTGEYEDENRFFEKLTGFEESMYFELFEYLWNKNKKPKYYICDDVRDIYDEIIKDDDNEKEEKYIINNEKINEFGDLIEELLKGSTKEKILEGFDSLLEISDLVVPEFILENIEDPLYKEKFKNICEKIDYKFEN